MDGKVAVGIFSGITAGIAAIFFIDKNLYSHSTVNISQGYRPENKITATGAYNNPGNIRKSVTSFEGEINPSSTASGFTSFVNMAFGYRAIIQLLRHYYNDGYTTIREMVSHYAPPSENDTEAYINRIASQMNIDADQDVHDLIFSENIKGLIATITKHEQGNSFEINTNDINFAYTLV